MADIENKWITLSTGVSDVLSLIENIDIYNEYLKI